MNKLQLNDNIKGYVRVRAWDVAHLARIAHAMRQEITDPRLLIHARRNYAEMIQAVDILVDGAVELEE